MIEGRRVDCSRPSSNRIVPGLHLDLGSLWGLDETSLGSGASVDDTAHLRSTLGLTLRAELGAGSLNLNLSYPLQDRAYDKTQILQLGFEAAF